MKVSVTGGLDRQYDQAPQKHKGTILLTPIIRKFQYGQHTVTIETGMMARQATAAVMVSMDDTAVFVTVVGQRKPNQARVSSL